MVSGPFARGETAGIELAGFQGIPGGRQAPPCVRSPQREGATLPGL